MRISMRQTGAIQARGNKLVNTFRHCTDDVKCKLLKIYIYNFYTAQFWCIYNTLVFHKFSVLYNNVFRALFNLDRRCSVSQEMTKRNIDTCAVVLRKLIYSMYVRVCSSQNVLLQNVMNSYISVSSRVLRNWYGKLFVVISC